MGICISKKQNDLTNEEAHLYGLFRLQNDAILIKPTYKNNYSWIYLNNIIFYTNKNMYIKYLDTNKMQYGVKIDNKYYLYHPCIQKFLFDLEANNNILEKKLSIFYDYNEFSIDIINNIQSNITTGKSRNIKIINVIDKKNIVNYYNI